MKYEDFYRENITENISSENCDIFISAYNESDRVAEVYKSIQASQKKYLLFPEYDINNSDIKEEFKEIKNNSELNFFFRNIDKNKNIVIDVTGFIRPYLIYLIKILKAKHFGELNFIYSEPVKYVDAENTDFSMGEMKVKTIEGFANETGSGSANTDNKIMIIGAGFDLNLFNSCFNLYGITKENTKILIGFPSLRPDMYQQNMLKIHELEGYTHQDFIYAPAHNPFITALTIDTAVTEFKKNKSIKEASVYLAPLSTKAQVLGFALYAIKNEDTDDEITIFFPCSDKYSNETSEGIARIWKYKINFSNL